MSWGKKLTVVAAIGAGMLTHSPAYAQDVCDGPSYIGTWNVGGERSERGWAIDVDRRGNVFYVGMCGSNSVPERQVDFDPTDGEDIHECMDHDDIFVTRMNADGTYGWTRIIGGEWEEQAYSIAVDSVGDVIVVGNFGYVNEVPGYQVDFDPTEGVDLRALVGRRDMFVTKLRSDGSYGWTHTYGYEWSLWAWDVAVDAHDNLYVVGMFGGRIDFDPGPGFDWHETEQGQLYVVKYAADGSFHWAATSKGGGQAMGKAVAVVPDGGVVVAGEFTAWQGVDFDPRRHREDLRRSTPGSTNDAFLLSLSPSGRYRGVTTFGGPTGPHTFFIWDIATDSRGDVILAGQFRGTVDLDPGPGEYVRSSPEAKDKAFLSRFDTRGDWQWSWVPLHSQWGSWVADVSLHPSGLIFLVGDYPAGMDFDPEGRGDVRDAIGGSDAFMTTLHPDGTYGWTATYGGGCGEEAHGVNVDPDGRILTVGEFCNTADFDPTEGVDDHYAPGGPFRWVPNLYVTRWRCGGCDAVYGFHADAGRGRIRLELSAAAPGGKALVRCMGGGDTIHRRLKLDDAGHAERAICKLAPGKYRCLIQKLRDAHGDPQCPRRASPRKVTVK